MSEEQPAPESESVEVNEAQLPEVEPAPGGTGGGQVDILLDTTVEVSASLGETQMEVREVLQLGPGSVVQLDRRVGEPVDLVLRGVRFAKGTLVVVGEQLGVRIKEILPPGDRTG